MASHTPSRRLSRRLTAAVKNHLDLMGAPGSGPSQTAAYCVLLHCVLCVGSSGAPVLRCSFRRSFVIATATMFGVDPSAWSLRPPFTIPQMKCTSPSPSTTYTPKARGALASDPLPSLAHGPILRRPTRGFGRMPCVLQIVRDRQRGHASLVRRGSLPSCASPRKGDTSRIVRRAAGDSSETVPSASPVRTRNSVCLALTAFTPFTWIRLQTHLVVHDDPQRGVLWHPVPLLNAPPCALQ
jgi:hypothetical protein